MHEHFVKPYEIKAPFDPEIILRFYFHFKPFPDSDVQRERERETVSLHRLSSSLKTYTPSIHPRWVSFTPIHPSVRSTPYFTMIHPKLNSSSTHPRPSSFIEQCPKHRQVSPSIFSCSNSTRNPKNPFLKPTPTNPPLQRTHSTNSSNPHWPPPISLSLCHLSPSLTLHCFCDFFVLIFFFFDCLYILILCNNICLDPKKIWETW